MLPHPPASTLFPYTTLFRSPAGAPAVSSLKRKMASRMIADLLRPDDLASRVSERSVSGSRRRSEEHTSELQSRVDLVCRLLLEKKNENPVDRGLDHRLGLHV